MTLAQDAPFVVDADTGHCPRCCAPLVLVPHDEVRPERRAYLAGVKTDAGRVALIGVDGSGVCPCCRHRLTTNTSEEEGE